MTSADYDNGVTVDLLECVETMDEEVESNGSTVADTPLYSRITGMRLNLLLQAANACKIRWMLYKKPDGETLVSALTDANFHSSNDVQNNRELRKYTVAKGLAFVSPDRLAAPLNLFVRRQAWKRISPMREGDMLSLILAKEADGTTATLSGFGTIWVKANG